MARDSYNDLIFQLGDLARERLPNKPNCPPTMEQVYEAEDGLVAAREELAALEQQMNDEDAAYQQRVAALQREKEVKAQVVARFRRAVDGIEGKVKELRKKAAAIQADVRYGKDALKKQEQRQKEMELAQKDPATLALGRENLKKMRLASLRKEREGEEVARDIELALTPSPGAPGEAGILAHKRILEIEDEFEARKLEFDARMAELDQAIAAKEQDVQAAEDYLDQTLFLLGEDCYGQRLADAALAPFYPRLDKAK